MIHQQKMQLKRHYELLREFIIVFKAESCFVFVSSDYGYQSSRVGDNTTNLCPIMEALKRALSPLQWSLSLSGCTLFASRSNLVNILVPVHGICLVLFFGLYIVSVPQEFNVHFTLMNVISFVWDFEFVFFSIISIIFVWFRRKRLMQLFQALSSLLTQNDLRNLRRLSIWLLIFRIVVTIITRYLVRSIHIYLSSEFSISIHHWDMMGMVIFIITIKTIDFAERNSMISMSNSIPEPKVIYQEICKWISIKDEAIVCIAPFPLMSFFHCFFYSFCSISRYHRTLFQFSSSPVERLKSSLFFVRIIVSFIQMYASLSLTSQICRNSKDSLNALQSAIFERLVRKPNQWLMVLEKIKEAKNYEYNALGMFPIKKSLLLPFLASFTTFTTFFVQIINQLNA